ncbi:FAD-binding oxidoreductase [Sphingomonas sp.]|uniref:FAD-binding oxidoreductase n=1 Tax=Sphingomonas sp. TaxID=28214 RepID=UPI003BAA18EB
MNDRDLVVALRRIVGCGHVLTDPSDLAGRDHDGRGPAGRSRALVRPRTTEEVAAVVEMAVRAGVTLVPQGARTGLVASGVADESGGMILLSTERLNAVAIDPVNRTARVGAGVSLSTLNAQAAAHDLFFPIDLGADPTMGGMIAANTGGARFIRYGDVRRNLLSLELVTSNAPATILQLGRDCWKQNDGLDLKQLAIGSGGAMGIITAATVALQPTPRHAITALIALRDPMALDGLLLTFERSWGMLLTAFEGISRPAYLAALHHVPHLRRPFPADAEHPYFVLIELAAGAAFDAMVLEDALAGVLAEMIEAPASPIADVVVDHGADLWALRHAVPDGLRAMGTTIGCDIAVRRGDVSRFRREMAAEIARDYPGLLVCDFGHIGDGGIHFNLVWPTEHGPLPQGLAEAVRMRIFAVAVERYGGSFSAEHGVGPRNIAAYHRFTPPAVQQLAGAVQTLLAPAPISRVWYGGPIMDIDDRDLRDFGDPKQQGDDSNGAGTGKH